MNTVMALVFMLSFLSTIILAIRYCIKARKPVKPSPKPMLVALLVAFVSLGYFFIFSKGASPEEQAKEAFEEKIGSTVSLRKHIINDKTGRWRVASHVSGKNVAPDYVLDYYNAYFESDDEVHFIINYGTNTTTRILYVAGLLDVVIRERVPKEELNAKTLGSGMLYSEYHIYKETGEVERIQ